ncbi:MAG TPA: hypothetical protein VNZ52_12855 [Candidatus Thermoplasmatota archaeon]|nr:hypothetical protein [Candidatus Thermoplasmatota archaeon]
MAEPARPIPARKEYVVRMRRPWLALLLPLVGALYFAYVFALAAGSVPSFGIGLREWVFGGLALFAILTLWAVLLLSRRGPPKPKTPKVKKEKAKAAPAPRPASPEVPQTAQAPVAAPVAAAPQRSDEILYLDEEYKGKRVLEVSMPPKSLYRGAVYTKTYVQVADDLVVRVEDLVEQNP